MATYQFRLDAVDAGGGRPVSRRQRRVRALRGRGGGAGPVRLGRFGRRGLGLLELDGGELRRRHGFMFADRRTLRLDDGGRPFELDHGVGRRGADDGGVARRGRRGRAAAVEHGRRVRRRAAARLRHARGRRAGVRRRRAGVGRRLACGNTHDQ